METVIDETKLKKLVKQAVEEVLVENKNLFSDLILEALEDIALIRAIKEGENSKTVSREEIFKV